MIRFLLLAFFAQRRWARRWLGGRWEKWYVIDTADGVWFRVDDFWRFDGDVKPSRFCRGRPLTREMWP